MFWNIFILFVICGVFLKFFKGTNKQEYFSNDDKETIDSNISYLRGQVDNMTNFESKARDILQRIKNISVIVIPNIQMGSVLETDIVRRMEEKVKDSSKKGDKLSSDRDKLKRIPSVNIPYFK